MFESPANNITEKILPSVSVVVPIYNGEKDLPDLIDCLRSQTYPSDRVEYLLVDNNSNDRTASILESACKELRDRGLQFKHLSENSVQSSYAARNKGIRSSESDLIAFTDADCRPVPTWLEEIVVPFSNPQVAIVVGELVALPGNSLLEKYAERCGMMSQHFLLEHPFCPYGQTANLAIRREAFCKVGLFRPYLTTGGDADICWRILRETDWQLTFAPKAIVRHRHRSNLQDLKSQWRRYGCSNRYLHELHGVDLMRELTPKESIYRLSRWLLKELPVSAIEAISLKAPAIDLIKTPIDLICTQARSNGQKESKLPELARKIEWL
jgi:glycosyltransferase involved in cell wall biosynthesis